MSWSQVGWLPPVTAEAMAPSGESTKTALVQKELQHESQLELSARRATQGVQRVHNYGAVGWGRGLALGTLCQQAGELWPLPPGPGSQSETSRAGGLWVSFLTNHALCSPKKRRSHLRRSPDIKNGKSHTRKNACEAQ